MNPYFSPRGIVKQATRPLWTHLSKTLRSSQYRRLQIWHYYLRILRAQRFVHGSVRYLRKEILFADRPSFLSEWDMIFVREIYSLPPTLKAPFVIDIGANIGMAGIYFQTMFPSVRGYAIEPDPTIFPLLEQNLRAWGSLLSPIRAAAADVEADVEFISEGGDGGRLNNSSTPLLLGKEFRVPAIKVSCLITQRVDLVKIDVEGAELMVLRDIEAKLGLVDRIFVEAHSFVGGMPPYAEILTILQRAGFRCSIETVNELHKPFALPQQSYNGIDGNVHIYGVRT